MAKQKKFEVEIQESKGSRDEKTIFEVLINGDSVGKIESLKKGQFSAGLQGHKSMKLNSLDEALEYIIREYNLHGKK